MRKIFVDSLSRAREKFCFKIIAYVIMPEHVHLLIHPNTEKYDIGHILASIKISVGMKSTIILKDLGKEKVVHFWQRGGGYDRNIITKDALRASIDYIHNNPVKRGLVESSEQWYWSSAGYYAGQKEYLIKMDEEVLEVLI